MILTCAQNLGGACPGRDTQIRNEDVLAIFDLRSRHRSPNLSLVEYVVAAGSGNGLRAGS